MKRVRVIRYFVRREKRKGAKGAKRKKEKNGPLITQKERIYTDKKVKDESGDLHGKFGEVKRVGSGDG